MLRNKVMTGALAGGLVFGTLALASPAEAHVSICKPTAFPVAENWGQISGNGQVYCGADAHNTSTAVQVFVKKDVAFRPDPTIAASRIRYGHAPGYTATSAAALCAGHGSYYTVVVHSLNGDHGPTYPVTTNSSRVTRC